MSKATGNCFENCAKYMLANPNADLTLVHCIVTGTGPSVKGVRYSHAFIIMADGLLAMDLTNSPLEPTVVPLEMFRKIGNVENEIHYCFGEALSEMQRTGHYGAWDDSIITEADIIPKRGKKGKRWS